MSRESLVLLLGLLIFFIPSFGIPNEWKTYMLMGSGVLLMIIGYTLRRSAYLRSIDTGDGVRATDSFVESAKKSTKDQSGVAT